MEYQALYRQFRPANFDEIVEQKAAVATLRKTVQTGKIGHAYLFCGQRGTGKTSIARVFARAINCENPVNGNPCNECAICKGIMDGSLMDVIEIDAASNRSIDNIRSICEEVSYAPSRARHKVYIIDEVHMITTEAFNALLKTLEEPPAHAVFLFATTEPHQIPPTILSRCQRFDFRRISVDAIKGRLSYICEKEKINCSEDALDLIASMSDGAMRDAISFLDQAAAMASGALITPESIEEMTGTVNIDFIADFATILIEGSFDKLPVKCKELADSGRDFIQFTLDLAEFFRNLLIIRVVPNPVQLISASAKTKQRMYEIANLTNSQTLTGFISSFSKTVSDLKWSPSVRTSFEIAMLRLCGRKIRMEEAPLVIPDFSKLQAQAAKEISEGTAVKKPSPFAAVSEEKPATAPAPEAPKAEEPAPTPAEEQKKDDDIPAIAKPSPFTAPIAIEPEVKEEKPIPAIAKPVEPAPAPAPEPEPAPAPAPEEPELDDEELDAPQTIPEEPVSDIPFPPLASAPAEEEIDEEDKPMENQIGLLFNEDADNDAPQVGIFANLSDSVLDDYTMDDLDEGGEEEEAPSENIAFGDVDDDLQAPTGRIGETKKTALSTAVDKSPIVRSKQPEPETDPRKVWIEIKSRVYEQDRHLGQVLASSRLALLGGGAYIILNSEDPYEARELGTSREFKQVSQEIKFKIEGINHVFSCTQKQYENVEKKYAAENPGSNAGSVVFDDSENSAAADFINSLGAAGLNTEIHFGDE